MAFQVRVHLEVVRDLFSANDWSVAFVVFGQSCQLSHCFRRRLRWAVMKCLSLGEMAMQVTSSSSLSRVRRVLPVLSSIMLTFEPWMQNK